MSPEKIIGELKDYFSNADIDFKALIAWLTKIWDLVGGLVGVLILFICVGIPIITGIELALLNIPPLTGTLYDEIDNESEKGAVRRVKRLMFKDAIRALKLGCIRDDEASTTAIYLKLKVKSLVICSFVVSLILVGSGDIVAGVMNIVQLMLKAINII